MADTYLYKASLQVSHAYLKLLLIGVNFAVQVLLIWFFAFDLYHETAYSSFERANDYAIEILRSLFF